MARVLYAITLLAVCAVFPVFVSGPVGYVPLFMALCSMGLSALYLRLIAHSLDLGQDAATLTCVRGEAQTVEVRLRNRSSLVMPRVEPVFVIHKEGGQNETIRARAALAGHEARPFRLDVSFDHIGIYEVGIERVEVFDLFGLFSRVERADGRVKVRVVPRVWRLGSFDASNPTTTDTARSVRTVMSDDMDYAAVREYALGDPMKRVHWKMSARGDDRLFTKLFESHTNPGTTVVVDLASDEPQVERRLSMYDAALETAFSILAWAHEAAIETTFVFRDASGTVRSTADNNLDSLGLLVDDIPPLGPLPARAASELLEDAAGDPDAQANFVFVTTQLTAQNVEALMRASAAGRGVRAVLVVPARLSADERTERLRQAERLAAAGIPFSTVEDASELAKGVLS